MTRQEMTSKRKLIRSSLYHHSLQQIQKLFRWEKLKSKIIKSNVVIVIIELLRHTLRVVCDGEWNITKTDTYKVGASYNIFLIGKETITVTSIVEDNKVHIMWLLPQYIVVTVGEILFSITSMEFAYSQAPPSMKSVLQALYLMTTAVGNLITMVIVEIFSAFGLAQV